MGPVRSDIVLIGSFAASLFTLDENLLNDGGLLNPRSAPERTVRPGTASIERATLVFCQISHLIRLSHAVQLQRLKHKNNNYGHKHPDGLLPIH